MREDVQLIKRSVELMHEAHAKRFRESGGPYEEHPVAVARIYRSMWPNDFVGQSGCLIHDVLEESTTKLNELRGFLGKQVGFIAQNLTKKPSTEFRSREERLDEYFGRLYGAAQNDPRIWLIKACDRWHNLMTIDALSPEKAIRILAETERYLLPLGWPLTEELRSLCLYQRGGSDSVGADDFKFKR